MSSNAWKAFRKNHQDTRRLVQLHADKGGLSPGRRWGLEVLNKSAVVLITAYWEAYCEDVAAEGLLHIVRNISSADKLPVELRKQLAKEIKAEPHELEVWKLAGDGWRTLVELRLTRLQEERNRKLNTPKSAQIDELFLKAVGIPRVSDCWRWRPAVTADKSRAKLDRFVTLRGTIAHRGAGLRTVRKADVEEYYNFINRVAGRTGGAVYAFAKQLTGKSPWV
jgi:hypothetical protein